MTSLAKPDPFLCAAR